MADGERSARLEAPIPVRWSIAEDEAMQRVVAGGEAVEEARWARSVHVEATGLKPGRHYWYRFTVRGKASPIGRTRTSPDAGERLAGLRFAFAAGQHYQQGYYTALAHMAQEDGDLVVFLGDYIYDISTRLSVARGPDIGRSTTLDSYRDHYGVSPAHSLRQERLQRLCGGVARPQDRPRGLPYRRHDQAAAIADLDIEVVYGGSGQARGRGRLERDLSWLKHQ